MNLQIVTILLTAIILTCPVSGIVCYKCQEFQYLNGTQLESKYASLKTTQCEFRSTFNINHLWSFINLFNMHYLFSKH